MTNIEKDIEKEIKFSYVTVLSPSGKKRFITIAILPPDKNTNSCEYLAAMCFHNHHDVFTKKKGREIAVGRLIKGLAKNRDYIVSITVTRDQFNKLPRLSNTVIDIVEQAITANIAPLWLSKGKLIPGLQ